MCAILRMVFLTQILNFFLNFLLKNTTTKIRCGQITPSHKCDKNQLCKYCTNTEKHTISIIITLLFSLDLTQKKPINYAKMKRNFFSKICLLLSHYRALDNKQANHDM